MPNEDAINPAGKTVLVLKMKCTNEANPNSDDFVQCEDFPALIAVTVIDSNIQKTTHNLSGSAGPSVDDSDHLQAWLSKHRNHFQEL